jgi:hypothetical protein
VNSTLATEQANPVIHQAPKRIVTRERTETGAAALELYLRPFHALGGERIAETA